MLQPASAAVTFEDAVREYDDGPDAPVTRPLLAKEQTFRLHFVEEVRRIVRDWTDPMLGCNPYEEVAATFKLRRLTRKRFSVWPDDSGYPTNPTGFHDGHALAAARLRGRHHAMAYLIKFWNDTDTDHFDPEVLRPWLRAVERWAKTMPRPDRIVPPPRPRIAISPTRLPKMAAKKVVM